MELVPDVDLRWPVHAIVGTAGFEFLPGLDGKRYEYQVFKGGNHSQFGNYGGQSVDGVAEISADEQQAVVVENVIGK